MDHTNGPVARPPRQRRHDRAGRRAALLAAALAEFAEQGYDAATTRAIAERAGCAEGLIHRYFGGKHGLLVAAMEDRAEELVGMMPALRADTGDLHADLYVLVTNMFDLMHEHAGGMRVGVSRALLDPDIARVLALIHRAPLAEVSALLRDHQQAGHIATGIDVDTAAAMVQGLAFYYGFYLQAALDTHVHEARRMAFAALDIVVRGLSPEHHP